MFDQIRSLAAEGAGVTESQFLPLPNNVDALKCRMLLADLGAEVIKIEQRGSGDPGRSLVQVFGQSLEGLPNVYFEANNRNKKGIALDLKTDEGKAIYKELFQDLLEAAPD